QLEKMGKSPPVFRARLVQVVETGCRITLEGPDVALIAAGHSAANIVAANGLQQVEMFLDVGNLEQIILNTAAEQQHRLTLVLPVEWVGRIRPDAVVGQPVFLFAHASSGTVNQPFWERTASIIS